jgi:hypothetical protein
VIRGLTKNDDYRKLVRAASARSLGQSNEIEMYMQQLRQQQSSIMVGFKKFLPKHVILKQAQVPLCSHSWGQEVYIFFYHRQLSTLGNLRNTYATAEKTEKRIRGTLFFFSNFNHPIRHHVNDYPVWKLIDDEASNYLLEATKC